MATPSKLAIVVHVYYLDLWVEIAYYLQKIETPFDLFITTTFEQEKNVCREVQHIFPDVHIRAYPNIGMDFVPFLHLIPELVEAKYLAVCKLHTKKGTGELGVVWRQALLQSLIGSQKTIKAVSQAFENDFAMVGLGAFYLSAKKRRLKENNANLKTLCDALSINDTPADWGFFAGSMFWVKTDALMPLALAVDEHPEWFKQTVQRDGAMEHALERVISLLPLVTKQGIAQLLPVIGSKSDFVLQHLAPENAIHYIGQAYITPLLHQYKNLTQDRTLLLQTGLFSYSGYLKQFPYLSGLQVDLLIHYLLIGRFQGATPHPSFDPQLYQQLHQQQLGNDEDSFLHYVRQGAKQNLSLCKNKAQENEYIPSFRYQVLNTVLIDWSGEKHKRRDASKVSIIISVLNQPELTQDCIEALYQFTQPLERFEVIIVDNGSKLETRQLLQQFTKKYANLSVLRNEENLNFALSCNLGFAESIGYQIIFLKNDTRVTENWLEPLLEPLECEYISAVQPRLLSFDGKIQCIGIVFSDKDIVGYPLYQGMKPEEPWVSKSRGFQAVTGACMALRASDFIQVRGMNPVYINGQEDVDLCLKINRERNGHCFYISSSIVYRHESARFRNLKNVDFNRMIFGEKWSHFYSPDDSFFYAEDGFMVDSLNTSTHKQKLLHRYFSLEFIADVGYSTDKVYRYESLGSDPNFKISFDKIGRKISSQWVSISLSLQFESVGQQVAKVYFDYGEGLSEKNSVSMTIQSNQSVSSVFRLDGTLRAIRFDPMERTGLFNVKLIDVHPLSKGEALKIMTSVISHNNADVSLLSIEEVYSAYVKKRAKYEQHGLERYRSWIDRFEKPNIPSQRAIIDKTESFNVHPLFSILLPVYNTEEKYLRECINSVIDQTYANWQLCISDDCSTDPKIKDILSEYAAKDPRIEVVYRDENGHISASSNSALSSAKGEFVVLLDHDDLLSKHALFYVACTVNDHPGVKIVYSDEDKIDGDSNRFSPHFKSDWNPDLFFSQNYVSHLGVYKREILTHIGGFRVGLEGSQDYDLLLRCLPYVEAEDIVHIPYVLYHWRAIAGSTALASGEKSYTTEAGIKALCDYFTSINSSVNVEVGMLPNTYHVCWPIPQPAPLVSLLIPTRDYKKLTETCVRSILEKTSYTNYEILILDNGSVETATLAFFEQIQREDERVRVLRYDYPFNYSAINNFGVHHSRGQIVGLINNDIEVISSGWLSEMVAHAVRPDIGCVGAKLYYGNDTIQHAGVILGIGGVGGHSHKHFGRNDHGYFSRLKLVQNLSAVTAACLLIRKTIYNECGGLDEENLQVAFNDVDFCLRVREAGYRNIWSPYAELYHHESISRGHEDTPGKKERFRKEVEFMLSQWGTVLKTDPYYSLNLTKEREDFSVNIR